MQENAKNTMETKVAAKDIKPAAPAMKAEAAAPAPAKRKPGRPAGSKNSTTSKAGKTKTTKKAADKKEMETKIVVQYKGRDAEYSALEEKIKEKFVAEGHRAGAIKKLEVYIKPEDSAAYYVINNGKYSDHIDLF
ncbi:MAG: DUF6465 family protein [Clostridiales bacterium]|nr:DUF6465 family protein [Clostridiales bacterium]